MIDQKSVCEALGEKLGATPQWVGNICKIETDDAELKVDESAGIELKIKNPAKAQFIVQEIKSVYKELR